MGTSATFALSLQRVCVFAVVTIILTGFVTQEASARFTDNLCFGALGSRDIYEKLLWVCDDCWNIFRYYDVGMNCKKDCFDNEYFRWCVSATERQTEMENFKRWISILGAGRK